MSGSPGADENVVASDCEGNAVSLLAFYFTIQHIARQTEAGHCTLETEHIFPCGRWSRGHGLDPEFSLLSEHAIVTRSRFVDDLNLCKLPLSPAVSWQNFFVQFQHKLTEDSIEISRHKEIFATCQGGTEGKSHARCHKETPT